MATVQAVESASEVWIGRRRALVIQPRPGRVVVGLAMDPLDRCVDLSAHPAAVAAAVTDRARTEGVAPQAAEASVRQALATACVDARGWVPPADAPLHAALGGAAMPLLGAAHDHGAAPLPQVPPWAAASLAEPTARAAATVAFPRRATSPVVRALVACVSPAAATNQVGLGVLALAMVGAPLLEPDALARVLRIARAEHPRGDLPDRATIVAAQRALLTWPAPRVERFLSALAERPDGLQRLAQITTHLRDLAGQLPDRLPADPTRLHDLLRTQIRTDPGPRPAPAAGANRRHRIYAPPEGAPVTEASPLAPAPAIHALDGRQVDGLTFVVPRVAGDLVRWSHLLHNCLDGYGPAAVRGTTTILGLVRGDQLRYALEVTQAQVLRQFVGPANRPPEGWVVAAVVRTLVTAGALDPYNPANDPWMPT